MLTDARDTAEAAVPPESAVSGETRPLVAQVAAPGAEPRKDAEQEASEEIARSDALLAAWESQRKEAEAAEPFALTVQPLMGGADAALTLDGVTQDTSTQALKERMQAAHPKHPAPDAQRLTVQQGEAQIRLEDGELPLGAHGIGPEGQTTVNMTVQDAAEAAARREARKALRAARAEAIAAAEARWRRQKALMLRAFLWLLGLGAVTGVVLAVALYARRGSSSA